MKTIPAIFGSALLLCALVTGCGDKPSEKKADESKKPETKAPETAKKESAPDKKADTAATTEKKGEPTPAPKEEAAPVKKESATKSIAFGKGDQKWTVQVPNGWKEEEPSNNMRMLQIRVPKKTNDPEDGDMAVFKMNGGGGADANIARWVAQFGGGDALKSKRTVKTAAGSEAVIAELEGDYQAMTGQGTAELKKAYKMLGAIIVLEGGGEIYFKFAGPYSTMEEAKPAFEKMIESFK